VNEPRDSHERIGSTMEVEGLPRQLADGVMWLGACTPLRYEGDIVHAYHSVYLVSGEAASLVVDTGNPKDWPVVDRQLSELLADGRPPVRYLAPTHSEMPHSGNLGRLCAKFPDAEVVGDIRDYHLFFPEINHRLRSMTIGEGVDLGGRTYQFVEPVIKDLNTSLWAYDAKSRVLFTGDGFAYMHHHTPDQCGLLAEEIPDLPLDRFVAVFAQFALYWTRHTDVRPHLARLDALLEAYPPEVIAPGHGSPIANPAATVERVKQGLLLESASPTA
jgi:flavorubredoxin